MREFRERVGAIETGEICFVAYHERGSDGRIGRDASARVQIDALTGSELR